MILENTNVYRACSEQGQKTIKEYGIRRHFSKNEALFQVHDEVHSLYLILSGYAVVRRESSSHGVRAIFLMSDGDLVNEVILDGRKSSVSCRTLSEVTAIALPVDIFLTLLQKEPVLNKLLIDSMAMKIRRLYHQVESTTKPTRIGHLIAARIWKFARDYGQEEWGAIVIPFDMRVSLLAEFVGSNRETVSRELKKMSSLDILDLNYGKCTIYDMDALKNYMQEG